MIALVLYFGVLLVTPLAAAYLARAHNRVTTCGHPHRVEARQLRESLALEYRPRPCPDCGWRT